MKVHKVIHLSTGQMVFEGDYLECLKAHSELEPTSYSSSYAIKVSEGSQAFYTHPDSNAFITYD
jgi:hypothetical protein